MRKSLVNGLLGAVIVLVLAVALFLGRQAAEGEEESFVGSDSQATTHIEESDPDYEPWINPVFEAGSSEIESGLFALQAALGAGVLGFALGALWHRSRTRASSDLGADDDPRRDAVAPDGASG